MERQRIRYVASGLLITILAACSNIDESKAKYLAKLDKCSTDKTLPDTDILNAIGVSEEQLQIILEFQYLKQLDHCLQPEKGRYLSFLLGNDVMAKEAEYKSDLKVLNSDMEALGLELARYEALPADLREQAESAFSGPFDPIEIGLKLLPTKD